MIRAIANLVLLFLLSAVWHPATWLVFLFMDFFEAPCDGPDWVGPYFSPTCADVSPADPEVFEHRTNQGALRQHQWEIRSLNSPASGCRGEKANKEKEGGANEDASGGPRDTTEQSVPIGDGRREETRTSVVPIGDRRTRLREAECDSPPHFWRSVASSDVLPERPERKEEETVNHCLEQIPGE
ncbi:hypothetical protein NDU88_006673 [Pleurodeles waltl]|uniref:Transmembrane protein n=1 Tax=Pleurodeles waltl TaxID=8319 RepID=A0AAV7LVI9_PLEWA|nr:hypothetical protein NDU88_006673 [Pleurodeles waltl]